MVSRPAPVVLLIALAACSDRPLPTAAGPSGSESVLVRGANPGTVREKGRYQVAMLDNCDAVSWAPLGGCAIQGTVTLPVFFATLASTGLHPDWRNAPLAMDVKRNAKLLVANVGGREHTFTRVAAFGGGVVPPLNRLPDTGVIAPECAALRPEEIVAPGASIEVRTDHRGHVRNHDEHYQCCFHPWMRTTVHVRHDAPR